MPVTTCSQKTQGPEALSEDLEARLAKMEQLVKTLMAQVQTLQRENEALIVDTKKLPEDIEPSHNRRTSHKLWGGWAPMMRTKRRYNKNFMT